jgi:hypothetical protein
VRLVIEQKFGQMVSYWPPNMESVPILDAIKLDTVCPNCSAVQAARALGISFGDGQHDLPFGLTAASTRREGPESMGQASRLPSATSPKRQRGKATPQC